jgi:CRISPR-associated protein Cas1
MMSLPDFREKHIAFIFSSEGEISNLRFTNENICLEKEGKVVRQVSCHKLLAVFIVGEATVTTKLVQAANERAVSLYLMKSNFYCYSALSAVAAGNYLLRQKQYTSSSERDLFISKSLVLNKIENQLSLLREEKKSIKKDFESYQNLVSNIKTAKELLGVEGSFTKQYFTLFFKEMDWYRRMPQAKPDIINVLLDLGYTTLFHFVDALLMLHGFDSYRGVYHTLFFQRKSLTCDVIEPLRTIVDRQILKSFRLNQINKKDFSCKKGVYSFKDFKIQQKYLSIFSEEIMQKKRGYF